MPTPPITYRAVQGTYESPDGSPVAGTLRFVPSATVYDSTGNVVVPPTPLLAVLDGSGAFSINLPCTDATGTSPTGWVWQLSELFAGGREVAFQLPESAPPATDITDLIPVEAVPAVFAYASQGSVAALDARVTALEAYDFTAFTLHPFLTMGA